MDNSKIVWWSIFIIMAIVIIWYYGHNPSKAEEKDLSDCLKRKGVKFYGASYCPYCKKQKAMFGDYADNLPYIECETPKNTECANEKITGYPTWIFPDGKRVNGILNMEQLKEYSKC